MSSFQYSYWSDLVPRSLFSDSYKVKEMLSWIRGRSTGPCLTNNLSSNNKGRMADGQEGGRWPFTVDVLCAICSPTSCSHPLHPITPTRAVFPLCDNSVYPLSPEVLPLHQKSFVIGVLIGERCRRAGSRGSISENNPMLAWVQCRLAFKKMAIKIDQLEVIITKFLGVLGSMECNWDQNCCFGCLQYEGTVWSDSVWRFLCKETSHTVLTAHHRSPWWGKLSAYDIRLCLGAGARAATPLTALSSATTMEEIGRGWG
jgi:hypothetical protein